MKNKFSGVLYMGLSTGIIEACIKEAKKSEYRFMLGCVVFKGTRIIAKAHNEIRSCANINPKFRRFYNSLHSEIAAFLNCKNWKNLKGADLLVMKVSKTTGSISNAKPCYHCQSAIKAVGIRNVYYSNADGSISMTKAKDLDATIEDLPPLNDEYNTSNTFTH